eukprot:jgi/Phyca11/109181/e_gw1.16.686.1
MIQPFYSDNSSVDKARTFWSAFERATEGLDDSIRLSAFRECLKGKTGEEWWTYSQINDFATLKTRFHNQFICQTPLQMIERLKTAKRSRGMSAEVNILDTSLVNSIPEAVTVLLYKNQHLPVEDNEDFADERTKNAPEDDMMKQMLSMMQQTQNLLVQ